MRALLGWAVWAAVLLCLPPTVQVDLGRAAGVSSPATRAETGTDALGAVDFDWLLGRDRGVARSRLRGGTPAPTGEGSHQYGMRADERSTSLEAGGRVRHNGVPGRKKGRPKGSKSLTRTERINVLGAHRLPKVVQQSVKGWELQFLRILQFKQHHGHCVVPIGLVKHSTGVDPTGSPAQHGHPDAQSGAGSSSELSMRPHDRLARWVAAQRVFYKRRCLSARRILRLDGVGFMWTVAPGRKRRDARGAMPAGSCLSPGARREDYDDASTTSWEDRYAQLVSFRSKHGHCNVPYKSKEAGELGRWVTTQRTWRRFGLMPLHRQRRLDAISFVWDLHHTSWHEYMQLLLRFRMHHGHASVPYRYMVHVPPETAPNSAQPAPNCTQPPSGPSGARHPQSEDAARPASEGTGQPAPLTRRANCAPMGFAESKVFRLRSVPGAQVKGLVRPMFRPHPPSQPSRHHCDPAPVHGSCGAVGEEGAQGDGEALSWDGGQGAAGCAASMCDWRGVDGAGSMAGCNAREEVRDGAERGRLVNLGAWVNNQRALQRKGRLSPEVCVCVCVCVMAWRVHVQTNM